MNKHFVINNLLLSIFLISIFLIGGLLITSYFNFRSDKEEFYNDSLIFINEFQTKNVSLSEKATCEIIDKDGYTGKIISVDDSYIIYLSNDEFYYSINGIEEKNLTIESIKKQSPKKIVASNICN